jgi:hypothetical protein
MVQLYGDGVVGAAVVQDVMKPEAIHSVVEIKSKKVNGLLDLFTAGELHSYINLPERHECFAFGQKILHPDNIFCMGENVLHLVA